MWVCFFNAADCVFNKLFPEARNRVYRNRYNHHHNSFQLHHYQQSSIRNQAPLHISMRFAEPIFWLFIGSAFLYQLLCVNKCMHSCSAVQTTNSARELVNKHRQVCSVLLQEERGLADQTPTQHLLLTRARWALAFLYNSAFRSFSEQWLHILAQSLWCLWRCRWKCF